MPCATIAADRERRGVEHRTRRSRPHEHARRHERDHDEQVDRRAVHAREVGDRPREAASRRDRRRAARRRSRACPGSRPPIVHTYTTAHERSARAARRSGTRGPAASPARWRICSATLTSASASRKWLITLTHASFTSTEMPPRIASHQNRPNRIHASRTRSRRRGRSWYAAITVMRERDADQAREDPVDLLDRRVMRRDAHELRSRCSWASRGIRARSWSASRPRRSR